MVLPVMQPDARVVVLGAGVTGLTVAAELAQSGRNVVLVENARAIGGLASTLSRGDLTFDTGSHRLHDGYHPEVDALIRELCGADLLRRPRNGVIFIDDQPVRYPPSASDILLAFGPRNVIGFGTQLLLARLRNLAAPRRADNFEDFTIAKVGRRLYERFYKPYAVKLYGMSPREISADPAMSRVRKFRLADMARDLARTVRGRRPAHYLYPASGIGQLSGALVSRFVKHGGRLMFISEIERLQVEPNGRIEAVHVRTRQGEAVTLEADLVVSTIPLGTLHGLLRLASEP